MNKLLLTLIILSVVGCSTSKRITKIEPHVPNNSFEENGRTYAYQDKDDVIVSIGYDGEIKKEFVFDLTVDNKSDSSIIFDPTRVYLFCYDTNNTLSNNELHYTQHPDSLISELNYDIDSLDKKVRNSAIFSTVLGLAYIGAEIFLAGSDIPEINKDLFRVSHMATQVILDETRYKNIDELDNLSYARCRIEEDISEISEIYPGEFHNGKMYFSVPESPYYKIYVPVRDNIFSFRFISVTN